MVHARVVHVRVDWVHNKTAEDNCRKEGGLNLKSLKTAELKPT